MTKWFWSGQCLICARVSALNGDSVCFDCSRIKAYVDGLRAEAEKKHEMPIRASQRKVRADAPARRPLRAINLEDDK